MTQTHSSGSGRPGDVLVMIGTVKGAFFAWSDESRSQWRLNGPYFKGESVYALACDTRGAVPRTFASTRSFHWGSVIRTSDDFGATWSAPDSPTLAFPESSGLSLVQTWQIAPARADEPDRLFAGVEPSCLFESTDRGASWQPVRGLLEHEHRPQWTPGGGGMCLHTIVLDPANRDRMGIAMSTGGFYRTDDGGATWRARNVGVRAQFLPNKYPEFGQCVHKVVNHPSRPEQLFLQNHWGLYRSDDWGDSWTDIAHGVPSDFGFCMQMHPHQPGTVYIIPMESDEFRCVPEGKLRVYRTTDAGASWQPLSAGLPQEDAYETVLRDGLSADRCARAGIYFGTRNGKVFGSADEGESWTEIADGLPSVCCVRATTFS